MAEFNEQMCEDLGGCPTKEECDALYRGELNEDESLRMSMRIMYCAGAPFPEEGDPVLTPEQIDADFRKIMKRLNLRS